MALRIQAEETAKTPTPQQPANRAATTMAHRLPDPSDAPFDWAKFFDEITEKWPVLFAAEKSKNPGAQPLGQNFSAATVQSPITRSVYTSMDGNTDVTVSYFADGFKIEPTQQYETGTTRHNVACDAKDALTAAITARKSYPAMAQKGVRLTADLPHETALAILAFRQMGFLITNEKELITENVASAMDKAQAEWKAFSGSAEFTAAFAPHAEKFTAPTPALTGRLTETLVNGNAGEYMVAAGIIDQKTYDERGVAQARLVALRASGKVPENELIELLKPENYKHAHAKFLGLGLGDAEIAAAKKYMKENNGANAKDEKIKVPFMGEISRVVFPGYDAKEQAALALQHFVRAMETLNGGLAPEKLAAQLKDLPRKGDSDQIKAIIEVHKKINQAVLNGEKNLDDLRNELAAQPKNVKDLFRAAGISGHESAIMYDQYVKPLPAPVPAAKAAMP